MPSETVERIPTRAEFSGEVNSIFRARIGDDGHADFKLIRLDEQVINDHQENFTILFKTGTDVPVCQGTYHLAHERLGKMSIFLVPVKLDTEGLYLEAVFNLLKQ